MASLFGFKFGRPRSRWRKRTGIILMYTVWVVFLEYVVIVNHMMSTDVEDGEHDPTMRDFSGSFVQDSISMNSTQQNTRNMTHQEVAEFMLGVNGSANLSRLATDVQYDQAKLHLIQMKLGDCVIKTNDIYKCLEDIYIDARHEFVQDNQGITPQPPPANVGKKSVQHATRRVVPNRPVPTDDPIKYEDYFTRKPEIVNVFKYERILSPKKGCDDDTFMVILVHSYHPYVEKRTAIRNSWGGVAKGSFDWPNRPIQQKMKFMFILGLHKEDKMNKIIANESATYDDIIQGNFMDAYVNMTLKSLLGLQYVSEHCPKVKYFLKSDDDMFINLPYLMQILMNNPLNNSIMGPLNVGSKVYRTGKWKVAREAYPFIYYPPYEAGSAYIITKDIVQKLFETAKYVPQFHVDDAYITGVVGKVVGVNHIKRSGFAFWTERPPSICDMLTDRKITGTKMTPRSLANMWNSIKVNPKCP